MKKKKIYLVALIMLTIPVWYAVKHYFHSTTAEMDAVWVQASKVREEKLPVEMHAIGTLIARSIEITSEMAGHVEKIYFQDGAAVSKDTPLIQLDDAIYKAKYESAKAKLAFSETNFRRMIFLGKKGAIAKQAIDQAESDLKERRAEARENEVMLNKMLLTAAFDGRVGKSKVNPGDYVTVGQSMVTLTDTKHLRIDYNVPERYMPLLKLGQAVSITTAAYPGKTFYGKVAFISPTINADNRSVSLYAEIPNEDNKLAPGMFVNVTHSLGTEERALMIPARSLVPVMDGEQVYKVVDNKAYAVTVVIGRRTEKNVQALQGLSVGDRVITDGQLKIKNGVPVKVKG